MKKIDKNILTGVISILVVFSMYIYFFDITYYSGDGKVKRGFVFYPIFSVYQNELKIGKDQTTTYTLSGLPSHRLNIGVRLLSKSKPLTNTKDLKIVFSELESSNVMLGMRLIAASNGDIVFEYNIAPVTKNWKIGGPYQEIRFWNEKTTNLKLDSQEKYKLVVEIKTKKDLSSTYSFRPFVEGGGITLP